MDCGFGGKSTKIGIVDVKEVLSDFRYSAKLNVSPGVHKMTKSKMATNRSVNILKRLIFINKRHKKMNEVSISMLSGMGIPTEPSFEW